MVSVAIIGTGNVGAQLAMSLLFHPIVDIIYIDDIDIRKLSAEYQDLAAASYILKSRNIVNYLSGQKADVYFLCAGLPRMITTSGVMESDDHLLETNLPIIRGIVERLPKEKCYCITNPSVQISEALGVHPLGAVLDKVRDDHALMSGSEILRRKGFTNFGIVSEAIKVMDDMTMVVSD